MSASARETIAVAVAVAVAACSMIGSAAIAGCAAWDAEARARDRARELMSCDDVELARAGESAWHASGCGRTVDVACTTSTNEPYCVQVRIAGAGSGSGSASETGAGSGSGSGTATASGASASVAETAIEREPVAPTGAGETGRVDPIVEPAHDARVRALLDARRDDVLACASRDRVVVRAAWSDAGRVAISLEGELSGSPEEGCVRAALGDLALDAPATPGVVVHLLRR